MEMRFFGNLPRFLSFLPFFALFAQVIATVEAYAVEQQTGQWGMIELADADGGALVVDIDRYGAAGRAGLFQRDVVVAAGEAAGNNMRRIASSSDLQAFIATSRPYHAVRLRAHRFGKTVDIIILPRGANRLRVAEYKPAFEYPWKRSVPIAVPSDRLDELDQINVLTQIAIDSKTGHLSLLGYYDPRLQTGAIPYLDILKTAIKYPEPSVSFPSSTVRSWKLSKDTGTIQLVTTLLAMPEAENERQIIIRRMSERLGLTREEYVDLYNFGHVDSGSGFAPRSIHDIVLKAFRHLGWTDAASAYQVLVAGSGEDVLRTLTLLKSLPQWIRTVDVQNSHATAESKLRIALAIAIMRQTGTSGRFPRHTERDLTELLDRIEDGDFESTELPLVMNRFYRFVAIDMFDTSGHSLQLDTLHNLVLSGTPAAILTNSFGIAPVSILTKDLDHNSQLARILAETDYSMKALTVRPEIFEAIPGFKTLAEYRREHLTDDECRNVPMAFWRWEFKPRRVDMQISPSGRIIRFGRSDVRVETSLIGDEMNKGLIQFETLTAEKKRLITKLQKINEDWYGRIEHDYDRYAEFLPALHEFREAAKIVAFARWSVSHKVRLDLADVVQVPANLPSTFDSLPWFHLDDPLVASTHLGSDYFIGVDDPRQFEKGWSGSIIGGASLKGGTWTTYSVSKMTETAAADQLLLSREIGRTAVEVAQSGDLETARYLAELSAQALAGGVSRATLARQGIVPPMTKPTSTASSAAFELQKELLRSTAEEIVTLKNEATDAGAVANMQLLGNIYDQVEANPRLTDRLLADLRDGKSIPTSPPRSTKSNEQPKTYRCGVCYDGLLRNINSKLSNNHMLSTFVDGALGYYRNCRVRAKGSCTAGDQFSDQLRVCDDQRGKDADYAVCIRQVICFSGYTGINCNE